MLMPRNMAIVSITEIILFIRSFLYIIGFILYLLIVFFAERIVDHAFYLLPLFQSS